MGVKQEQRFQALDRQRIDALVNEYLYTKADQILAGRIHDQALRDANRQLEDAHADIEELERQLACQAREISDLRAMLAREREQTNGLRWQRDFYMTWYDRYQVLLAEYREIWQIVHLAMSPSRYHMYREIVLEQKSENP
jgi:septal ring factor EnvC (AmiA/AmiB activator)